MKKISILFLFMFLAYMASSQTIGIKILTNGDVGIGEANPVEKLDVNGAIKIGTTSTSTPGTLRFNGNCFEGFDGTSWVSLGGSGCSGSTGGGGGAASCEDFGDLDIARDLPLIGWRNEYSVGGNGLTGDGEVCWKVQPHIGNTQQCLGLSTDPTANATLNSVDFGIHLYARSTNNIYRVYVRESGASQGLIINQTTDFDGSIFCVRRTGTLIEYVLDGVPFYTSSVASTGTLYFDNSYYDSSGNAIWGVRPSSSHYTDVEICPLNTYTVVGDGSPSNSNRSNEDGSLNDYNTRIEALEDELETLKRLYLDQLTNTEDINKNEIDLVPLSQPELSQNVPNPSNNNSLIRYYIPEYANSSEIIFYSLTGREISRIELSETGRGELSINTEEISSTLLTYTLVIDGEVVQSRKMSIIK